MGISGPVSQYVTWVSAHAEDQDRLVIGVASSALFDLSEPEGVFQEYGPAAYHEFQDQHLDDPLPPGVAMPFISRLLRFNELEPERVDDPLVDVIVMSRNSAVTGLRVMRSVEHYGLPVIRAVFTSGRSPFAYCPAFGVSLFLSADEPSVRAAIHAGVPAGQVLQSASVDDSADEGLRVAFDFDGVLADDQAEAEYAAGGLVGFQHFEADHIAVPHNPGPLKAFLTGLAALQRRERQLRPNAGHLRVAIITARSIPAHERAINTLRTWGVEVDDMFFLAGADKGNVVEVLRPHIYFDDQAAHLTSTRRFAPSVHIPFGIRNAD